MLEHRGQGAVNEFARELPWRFKVSAFWVVSLNLKLKVTLPPDLFSLLKHMWHRGRNSKGEKERWSQGAQRAQIKVSWELSVNTEVIFREIGHRHFAECGGECNPPANATGEDPLFKENIEWLKEYRW